MRWSMHKRDETYYRLRFWPGSWVAHDKYNRME
jgi:hypothetical protein